MGDLIWRQREAGRKEKGRIDILEGENRKEATLINSERLLSCHNTQEAKK